MSTPAFICNMALGHIGVLATISDLDADSSNEAKMCRRFYESTIKESLSKFPFSFAKSREKLQLVSENTTGKYKYSYRKPTKCLRLIKVYSPDSEAFNRINEQYEIETDDSGDLIQTNIQAAYIEFTKYIETVSRYSTNFQNAVSYLLAAKMITLASGGDPFKLKNDLLSLYTSEMNNAKALDLAQINRGPARESEFITARD